MLSFSLIAQRTKCPSTKLWISECSAAQRFHASEDGTFALLLKAFQTHCGVGSEVVSTQNVLTQLLYDPLGRPMSWRVSVTRGHPWWKREGETERERRGEKWGGHPGPGLYIWAKNHLAAPGPLSLGIDEGWGPLFCNHWPIPKAPVAPLTSPASLLWSTRLSVWTDRPRGMQWFLVCIGPVEPSQTIKFRAITLLGKREIPICRLDVLSYLPLWTY